MQRAAAKHRESLIRHVLAITLHMFTCKHSCCICSIWHARASKPLPCLPASCYHTCSRKQNDVLWTEGLRSQRKLPSAVHTGAYAAHTGSAFDEVSLATLCSTRVQTRTHTHAHSCTRSHAHTHTLARVYTRPTHLVRCQSYTKLQMGLRGLLSRSHTISCERHASAHARAWMR